MASPLHTPICDLLGMRHPILQTGMGWVATPELVAAACNAGAFGFLAAATLPPPEVAAAIEQVKRLTERPFGVNFLMDAPGADVIADAIIRLRVRAAGYNRAPDPKLISRLKDAGVACVPTCGAPRHAVKAQKLGADAIIVQGGEGGGHTGTFPTSLLVPACVDAVDVPVIAAGGFRDGRGLVAALAFGAAGIAMGTRFLLTRESPVPDASAQRYFAAQIDDVLVTQRIDGLPQRVVRNELVDRLERSSAPALLLQALRSALAYRKVSGASLPELLRSAFALRRREKLTRSQMIMAANAPMLAKRGVRDGDPVGGYLPSGTVAGLIEDRPSCAELVGRIVDEAERTLAALRERGSQWPST
jgi:NAD(P)H-dependent flavin oxidoreductase YrpB (nitropropane dioxygenase family)